LTRRWPFSGRPCGTRAWCCATRRRSSPCLGRSVRGGAGPSRGEVTDASERSWLAEHILPADQRRALLRRCLTDAQLSTPLRGRGVARAAVRTDTHANRHVDPARRHAPRRHDPHHLASTAGVDAHSVGRPWSASSASPAPRTRDRSDPAEPVHPGYSPAHDLAHTNEPDISARRSMNSSDCRFVPAAAPRCAT